MLCLSYIPYPVDVKFDLYMYTLLVNFMFELYSRGGQVVTKRRPVLDGQSERLPAELLAHLPEITVLHGPHRLVLVLRRVTCNEDQSTG